MSCALHKDTVSTGIVQTTIPLKGVGSAFSSTVLTIVDRVVVQTGTSTVDVRCLRSNNDTNQLTQTVANARLVAVAAESAG